jgi:hypothetical protein
MPSPAPSPQKKAFLTEGFFRHAIFRLELEVQAEGNCPLNNRIAFVD